MPFLINCFVLNILCLLVVYGRTNYGNKAISIDYYGRGVLRHTRVNFNCELDLHKEYCRFKCSKTPAVCIAGNCYCVQDDKGLTGIQNSEDFSTKESAEENVYYKNYPLDLNIDPKNQRRHHIAHFCPDLEEARKCIRKCMTLGKPAFCGKDHVCYCSHNTKRPGIDKELNVTSIYAQFKDMYDKYFGTGNKKSEESKDYNNDIVDAGSGAVEDTNKQDNHQDFATDTVTENGVDKQNNVIQETPDNAADGDAAANPDIPENAADGDAPAAVENPENPENAENTENAQNAQNAENAENVAEGGAEANPENPENAGEGEGAPPEEAAAE